jgi:hypothetical protein
MRPFHPALALAVLLFAPSPARAQQPLVEVLSFLLTNRSIATGDFVRDEQAAARMRDAFVEFLQAELTNVPMTSPASGFTYRLDQTIGASVRSTSSFGPFFTERSLTGGRQVSFGLGFSRADFEDIDGRNLRSGTLIATASQLQGEAVPFDAETLTLRLRTSTVTVTGLVGLTDRLDVSAAVPVIRIDLSGQRIDTYRGTALLQSSALAHATGVGDVVVRAKYNVFRVGGGGVAIGGDVRLPTGDARNLLGTGSRLVTPRVIASLERDRLGAHGQLGYGFGGTSDELTFSGAVTMAASPRVTLIGEILGRRLGEGGRLSEVVEPHPTLGGVETIRLSSTPLATTRVVAVGGIRWNVASRWLLNANVLRPMTTPGLNARWIARVTLDYSLGG